MDKMLLHGVTMWNSFLHFTIRNFCKGPTASSEMSWKIYTVTPQFYSTFMIRLPSNLELPEALGGEHNSSWIYLNYHLNMRNWAGRGALSLFFNAEPEMRLQVYYLSCPDCPPCIDFSQLGTLFCITGKSLVHFWIRCNCIIWGLLYRQYNCFHRATVGSELHSLSLVYRVCSLAFVVNVVVCPTFVGVLVYTEEYIHTL